MVCPTKKRVAVVVDLYQKSSKGYFPELSELLQGIKSVRDKIKKKKTKKNEDIFWEFHCLCQLGPSTQEPV